MTYNQLTCKTVAIDAKVPAGPFPSTAHCVGHGGINSKPLPERVVHALQQLHPRRVRTFIQEYFHIYPEHGKFNFSLLDPYMESLHSTGGDIVAALCIKPPVLYPNIDQDTVFPTDWEEWKTVVKTLVHRYSVQFRYVTHWEIGNEVDIGETGGCPYRMHTSEEYLIYYSHTVKAVLEAFPQAKVGGPGLADSHSNLLPGFVQGCVRQGLPLHFISWHGYSNDYTSVREQIRRTRALLTEHYGKDRPHILVTEYGPAFERHSIPEQALSSYRAVNVAGLLFTAVEEALDESYYYHVWDQVFYCDEFSTFFRDPYIMQKHWNEVPHRFGMFSVDGEVRPAYFVYKLFCELGDEALAVTQNPDQIWLKAARGKDGSVSVMLLNSAQEDEAVQLDFSGLTEGEVTIENYRLDGQKRWEEESLKLFPIERRTTCVWQDYSCQLYSPAQSVSVLKIIPKGR